MSQVTLEQALQMAIASHRNGDLVTAEGLYRQILVAVPHHLDARHLLGVACRQQGRLAEALPLLEQCASEARRNPDILTNYGEALLAAGQAAAAEKVLRQAVQAAPAHAQALNNLGLALHTQGKTEQAIAAARKALAAQGGQINALNNLGNYLLASGKAGEAAGHFRAALDLAPTQAEIAANLVLALEQSGDREQAWQQAESLIAQLPPHARLRSSAGRLQWARRQFAAALVHFEEALRLLPDDAGTWNNYGLALHDAGRGADAVAAYQRALQLDPAQAGAWSNLGITLKEQGALSDALTAFERALALQPEHAQSWSNLGMTLEIAGRADEAVHAYQRAIAIDPQLDRAHSNLLFALNYLPDQDAESIAAAHRQWAVQHVAHLYPSSPRQPPAIAARRLRVGLLSPDLRRHPVGFLLLPYLRAHDRHSIELHLYADSPRDDDITAELRSLADVWHEVSSLSHQALADQVRADGIDLLVDLAGHSANHRLPVFARQPAPVQASWIGYFTTTGLTSIDYFLTDPASTPAALAEQFTERPLYLPHSRFCYQPPAYAPAVAPLPMLSKGTVTFGCFNNLAKLNAPVLACWAAILQAVPGSRLLLKALGLNDSHVRADLLARFAALGIGAERLDLRSHSPHPDMLAEYHEIDIALDPFPFSGGMTTCEALCMGVPVLTLTGATLAGRQGHSLLLALAMADWCASSVADYVAKATAWAAAPAALQDLRTSLRQRFLASPAGDAAGFARAVDAAWLDACGWHRQP